MEDNLDELLEFGLDIARHAGEIMRKYFNENNGSSYKGDNTIVTSADLEINHYLIKRVKETYPDHSVYGEEESLSKSYKEWICDPVDGTAMYARQIPVAVFSLSYCVNGIPLVVIELKTPTLRFAFWIGSLPFLNCNKFTKLFWIKLSII